MKGGGASVSDNLANANAQLHNLFSWAIRETHNLISHHSSLLAGSQLAPVASCCLLQLALQAIVESIGSRPSLRLLVNKVTVLVRQLTVSWGLDESTNRRSVPSRIRFSGSLLIVDACI
jgi:hypothetical protein